MAKLDPANFADPYNKMSADELLKKANSYLVGGAISTASPDYATHKNLMSRYWDKRNKEIADSAKAESDALEAKRAAGEAKFDAYTVGRGQQIMDDPRIASAMQRLEQMQASGGPFSDKIQQQLINRQADMTAGAEAANAGAIRRGVSERGGSMADPSAQAAMLQQRTARQQANVANAGDIGTRAALANFDASRGLASQIANMRLSQYGASASPFAMAAQAEGAADYSNNRHMTSFQPFQAPNIPQQRQAQGQQYQAPQVEQAPQYTFDQPAAQPQQSGGISPTRVPAGQGGLFQTFMDQNKNNTGIPTFGTPIPQGQQPFEYGPPSPYQQPTKKPGKPTQTFGQDTFNYNF